MSTPQDTGPELWPDPHALADDDDDLDWDVNVHGRMREAATSSDDAVPTVPYLADEVD